jgi:hypothetical protein
MSFESLRITLANDAQVRLRQAIKDAVNSDLVQRRLPLRLQVPFIQ